MEEQQQQAESLDWKIFRAMSLQQHPSLPQCGFQHHALRVQVRVQVLGRRLERHFAKRTLGGRLRIVRMASSKVKVMIPVVRGPSSYGVRECLQE